MWIALLILLAAAAASSNKKAESDDSAPPNEPERPELEDVETIVYLTYTITLGRDETNTWDWRVYLTSIYDANPGDLEGRQVAMGFDERTREEAIGKARQWVDAELQLSDGAGPAGVSPVPQPLALTRRGLRLSADCHRITVVDLEAWIAHASAVASNYDVAEPEANEVMELAFSAAFPECDFSARSQEIRGSSWAKAASRVQGIIDKLISDQWLSVEPVEAVIAARMVDMSVPAVPHAKAEWHTGANNGNRHALVAVPRDDGMADWWAWAGQRGDIQDAIRRGSALSPTMGIAKARAAVDEYFNTSAETQ